MPPVGFEPTISAGERPQTDALDRAATGTVTITIYDIKIPESEGRVIGTHGLYWECSAFIPPTGDGITSLTFFMNLLVPPGKYWYKTLNQTMTNFFRLYTASLL